MGAAPASMAKAASERSRPGCDQLISTWAAVMGPMPGWASSAGATARASVPSSLASDEALVVQVGVDLGELGGQPLSLIGQQQLPDGGLRIGLAQHRDLQGTRRQENHNGVIQPRTGPHPPALPQLTSPFHPSFFRGK
jgi:hypothetical protein